jgi:hypothetical protein
MTPPTDLAAAPTAHLNPLPRFIFLSRWLQRRCTSA